MKDLVEKLLHVRIYFPTKSLWNINIWDDKLDVLLTYLRNTQISKYKATNSLRMLKSCQFVLDTFRWDLHTDSSMAEPSELNLSSKAIGVLEYEIEY